VISEYQNVCGGQWCWAMEYIRLNGQFLAEYKEATTYSVLADHLGSTRVMTQVNQAVLDSMDYEPFRYFSSAPRSSVRRQYLISWANSVTRMPGWVMSLQESAWWLGVPSPRS